MWSIDEDNLDTSATSDEYDPCGWDWQCIGEKIVNLTKYNHVYESTNIFDLCAEAPTEYCWHVNPIEISLKSVALFILMLFGIPGNLSIIIIILKNRLLRKQPNNLFLLNMAVTDLLNLTVNTTLYFFRPKAIFKNYYLGPFLCKLSPLLVSEYHLHIWYRINLRIPTFSFSIHVCLWCIVINNAYNLSCSWNSLSQSC